MTLYSILAMAIGLVILAWLPLSKDRRIAIVSQGSGAVLFGTGLVGFIYGLMPHVV